MSLHFSNAICDYNNLNIWEIQVVKYYVCYEPMTKMHNQTSPIKVFSVAIEKLIRKFIKFCFYDCILEQFLIIGAVSSLETSTKHLQERYKLKTFYYLQGHFQVFLVFLPLIWKIENAVFYARLVISILIFVQKLFALSNLVVLDNFLVFFFL